jgi:hypothetical protein
MTTTTNYRQAEGGTHLMGVAERPEPIPERLLWKLWKNRAALQEGLRTEAGRRVRVLYPGRPGISAGPDFRDAILEIEGLGLVRGDVELHLRQRDWAAHGHSSDPHYNGVVVHGALQVDTAETPLQNGGRVPMVSLESLLAVSSPEEDPAPKLDLWALLAGHGFSKPETAEEAGELLDRAGDQRFLGKASTFRRFLQEQGPDQTLYEALMEGLGYRQNRQPFLRLAYLAPYSALKRAAEMLPEGARAEFIASWLLGISGLSLQTKAALRPPGLRRTMAKAQWHLFRVRPSNHPVVRIGGAGELIDRYLVPGLVGGLSEASEPSEPSVLTSALTVKHPSQAASIGAGRARDLAVNAVLPFFHAHYGPGSGQAYLSLFQKFPRLEGNEVVQEMTAELLPQAWHVPVDTARRQQGLLHLAALLKGANQAPRTEPRLRP